MGDNVLDNVEQVYIPNPVSGTYTVQVTHKGNLQNGNPQWVSIVVNGNAVVPASPLVINQILQTSTNTMAVSWPAVVGGQYQLQVNTNLLTTNWMNMGVINARLPNIVAQVPMSGPQAFYRVLQLQ